MLGGFGEGGWRNTVGRAGVCINLQLSRDGFIPAVIAVGWTLPGKLGSPFLLLNV